MDKRLKRHVSDIQKSLSADPSKIPSKKIEKLIGKMKGQDRLETLLIATKHALESQHNESAQLLATICLTSFPENADCWDTVESLLLLSPPPTVVWRAIENYLRKTADGRIILRFREQIRLAGQERLVTLLSPEQIKSDPVLIGLEASLLSRQSPELAWEKFELGLELMKMKPFPEETEGEFLYYCGEHLLSLGRYTDIDGLLTPFVSDLAKFKTVSPEKQNTLRAVLSSAQSRLGDDLAALETSLTKSIDKLPIQESNSSFVYNIALIFSNIGLRETAAELYDLAFNMDKTDAPAGFHALYQRSHACHWENRGSLEHSCEQAISVPFKQGTSSLRSSRMLASCAFPATTLFDSLEIQSHLLDRSLEAAASLPANIERPHKPRNPGGKIKIAYLSSDIYSHATAFLISGLLETHDRTQFDVHVFSYGFNHPDDPFRRRIREAVNPHFLDVSRWDDQAICASMINQGIDIAIDLKGFTQNGRPFLLNSRPAPIQINYLGYPASMGSPAIDYFVGDQYTLTDTNRCQFSEKMITLPIFYQPPDSNRQVAPSSPDKTSHGLPDDKIVMGAFNSIYKITPDIFQAWLQILKEHPNTVLWLVEPSKSAQKRLLQKASDSGLNPANIVFAPFLEQDEHVNRLKLIDIFVDTYPCVGHTTATDILFQGVPLVTIAGDTFASRVAASALHHIECQELIAHSLEEYKQIVATLVNDSDKRRLVREKITENTVKFRLFDTTRYTETWETALKTVYERWTQGQKPIDLSI